MRRHFFISDAILPFYDIPLLFLITTGTDKTFDWHSLFLVVERSQALSTLKGPIWST